MPQAGKRIVVAMSGGVDSSVAAALLKRGGHEIIGVTLRMLPSAAGAQVGSCGGLDASAQARAMAEQLSLPHHTLDCQQAFSHQVLEPSWRAYQAGQTPNPCVWCNRHIKFGELLHFAAQLGATHVASGHHARLLPRPDGGSDLHRGHDRNKDQSYFLYALRAEQRERILFPIGDLDKSQVRAQAREFKLAVADSPESQDACFLTAGQSFPESLRTHFGSPPKGGPIEDDRGRRVGQHDGVHAFTIGQRRGLGVALGEPAWVLSIDASRQRVVVTCDPERLLSRSLIADQIVLGQAQEDLRHRRVMAQIRYRHPAAPAELEPQPDGRLRLHFDHPQRAITPGQAVVFYDGDRVLGGGRIAAVESGDGSR